MKFFRSVGIVVIAFLLGCTASHVNRSVPSDPDETENPHDGTSPGNAPTAGGVAEAEKTLVSGVAGGEAVPTLAKHENLPEPEPIAPFVDKAIEWIVKAQHENGGWGAGSHAKQNIRDPHAVSTDPATTGFTAMALLRAGHTPVSGSYREVVKRATEYLAGVVEECPADGPRITDLKNTQPQQKLGPLVDTSVAALYLSRVLTTLPERSELRERVDAALDKCLAKLEMSQQKDGGWGKGGWAPVLQSSFGCSALELAKASGKEVDEKVLEKARQYQRENYRIATGRAALADAAGVELYAFSGSQRGTAGQARAANKIVETAKKQGKLAVSAEVSEENLRVAGVNEVKARELWGAFATNRAQIGRLGDEQMLQGFGNKGGEEYLSYMLSSESLVITGGEPWEK